MLRKLTQHRRPVIAAGSLPLKGGGQVGVALNAHLPTKTPTLTLTSDFSCCCNSFSCNSNKFLHITSNNANAAPPRGGGRSVS